MSLNTIVPLVRVRLPLRLQANKLVTILLTHKGRNNDYFDFSKRVDLNQKLFSLPQTVQTHTSQQKIEPTVIFVKARTVRLHYTSYTVNGRYPFYKKHCKHTYQLSTNACEAVCAVEQ